MPGDEGQRAPHSRAPDRSDAESGMRYHGSSPKNPDEVLGAIATLGDARSGTWAGSEVWSPIRIYTRVEGSEFQAARGGGGHVASSVLSGVVMPGEAGSTVEATFSLGIWPTWLPPVLFVLLCVGASLGWVLLPRGTDAGMYGILAFLPALGASFWWLVSYDRRRVLEALEGCGSELSWSRPR